MADEVVVVDYDPNWAILYEQERERILKTLGDFALTIEHIGSTAVPGLAAKPIIDILVGVHRATISEIQLAAMTSLGYDYRGESGIPGRLFFGKGMPRVHVVEFSGAIWTNHLLFRDYLRAHSEAVEQYALLKRQLARRFRHDRGKYTDNKAPFIAVILEKARGSPA